MPETPRDPHQFEIDPNAANRHARRRAKPSNPFREPHYLLLNFAITKLTGQGMASWGAKGLGAFCRPGGRLAAG